MQRKMLHHEAGQTPATQAMYSMCNSDALGLLIHQYSTIKTGMTIEHHAVEYEPEGGQGVTGPPIFQKGGLALPPTGFHTGGAHWDSPPA